MVNMLLLLLNQHCISEEYNFILNNLHTTIGSFCVFKCSGIIQKGITIIYFSKTILIININLSTTGSC